MTRSFTRVSSGDLEAVRTLLAQGVIVRPWSQTLPARGLASAATELAPFDDVEPPGLLAAIDVVLAERVGDPAAAEIVWTGPEPYAPASRDTAAVVAGMLRGARHEVLLASFSLDVSPRAEDSLFRPLHDVMAAHGVTAHVFFDLGRLADAAKVPLAEATRAEVFRREYWPFGDPAPQLYYDPRALEPQSFTSMHAKMVIVDDRWVLVGSANLTDRGTTRNIELGVKLDDRDLAVRLKEHWLGAVTAQRFTRAS